MSPRNMPTNAIPTPKHLRTTPTDMRSAFNALYPVATSTLLDEDRTLRLWTPLHVVIPYPVHEESLIFRLVSILGK